MTLVSERFATQQLKHQFKDSKRQTHHTENDYVLQSHGLKSMSKAVNAKQQQQQRRSSLLRSPSIAGDTWNWFRRKKNSRVSSDGDRGAGGGGGVTSAPLSRYDRCRKSQSMTSLDQLHTLSYNTGSCDNLSDASLFQRGGGGGGGGALASDEYQLWVRTGKDEPPYPLIGTSLHLKLYQFLWYINNCNTPYQNCDFLYMKIRAFVYRRVSHEYELCAVDIISI